MSIPPSLMRGLKLPAIAAPLFLASGPDLVVETCRSGVIGTFPALNQRSTEGFEAWLHDIERRLAGLDDPAVFGVNLIVHKTNERLQDDLAIVVKHKVPLVITSLGAVPDIVDAIHSYGGLVFHDVISRRHAEKAAEAGVDGIIAVSAGAGGHAGTLNPFALLHEIRSVFSGTVILSGAISTGRDIAAARVMGADFAYLGTRFLATQEAAISDEYREMMQDSRAADIVYTPNISGIPANFMRKSIVGAGLDPDHLPPHGALSLSGEAKAWKKIWSAGQGVGAIEKSPTTAVLCTELIADYTEAAQTFAQDPFLPSSVTMKIA
jgi:nitronate monooxygenase